MRIDDYCSFEVAKLLKEKGISFELNPYNSITYLPNGEIGYWEDDEDCVISPPLQMVIKYLRLFYKIEIIINVCKYGEECKTMYSWTPVIVKKRRLQYPISQQDGSVFGGFCPTYEESVESGIKYCIENLL